MRHLQHHSLAILLIELMETQITASSEKKDDDRQRLGWENSDNSEEESTQGEGELTPQQKVMAEVLAQES